MTVLTCLLITHRWTASHSEDAWRCKGLLSGRPTPAEAHLAVCINYTLLILRRNVKCLAQVPVIQWCKMNFKVILNIDYEKQNSQQDETSAWISPVRWRVDWCGRLPKNSQSFTLNFGSSGLHGCQDFGELLCARITDVDSLQGSLGI